MIDDENFRSGHDNFIVYPVTKFSLNFSIPSFVSVPTNNEYFIGSRDINNAAWNKSYSKQLDADFQNINFHLSPELSSFPSERRRKKN